MHFLFACEQFLPFQRILKKILVSLGITDERKIDVKTSVWEDNVGALTLAKLEPGQMTPRSKHFRSHIKPSRIEVNKIDTKDQKADILAKDVGK